MSFNFSGVATDYVRIFPTGVTSTAFTITAAVKRVTDLGAFSTILALYDATTDKLHSVYLDSNGDDLRVAQNWYTTSAAPASNTISAATWFHIALVGYLAGGTTPTLKLFYKNNAGTTTSVTLAQTTINLEQFIWGSQYGNPFAGRVANVKFWGTALSDADVALELSSATVVNSTGLICYSDFNGADFTAAQTSDTYNQAYAQTWAAGGTSPTLNADAPTYGITLSGSDTFPSASTITLTSNTGASTWAISVNENSTAVGTVAASGTGAITYSITGGADIGKFAVNSASGVVTFVSAPDYEAPADANNDNVYIVVVRATDTTLSYVEQTLTVTVLNVLETLSISVPGVINNGSSFTVTVLDEGSRVVNGAVITWTGTPAGSAGGTTNTLGQAVLTAPTAPATVTLHAVKGAITVDKSVVVGSNTAPTITSNGSGSTAQVSIISGFTYVTTVTATDPDTGQSLVYGINGGSDASKFTINSSTGVLSFLSAPNYASPGDSNLDNNYVVNVTVTDGIATTTQIITVRVLSNIVTKTIKAYIHRKALGTTGISGIVWEVGTGGDLVGAKLFEFSGLNFSGALVNNKTELVIPIPVTAAAAFTAGQIVKVFLYSSAQATLIFDATVYAA